MAGSFQNPDGRRSAAPASSGNNTIDMDGDQQDRSYVPLPVGVIPGHNLGSTINMDGDQGDRSYVPLPVGVIPGHNVGAVDGNAPFVMFAGGLAHSGVTHGNGNASGINSVHVHMDSVSLGDINGSAASTGQQNMQSESQMGVMATADNEAVFGTVFEQEDVSEQDQATVDNDTSGTSGSNDNESSIP